MTDKSSVIGPLLLGAAVTGATGICLYLLLNQEKNLNEEKEKKAEEITLEIWIESKDVGVLLGRQGTNLREIQSRSNTRIWFLDTNSVNQTKCKFFIRGTADDVQYAEILIHQTISMQPKLEKYVIKVPRAVESTLIGKNGERKRRLEVKSRCKLEVDRENSSSSGEEISIILKGTKDQIETGKKLVEEAIQQHLYIYNKVNRNGSEGPQPALAYKQPLFLKYQDQGNEDGEGDCDILCGSKTGQETLRSSGADQLVQVYVSSIATPSRFWVQNVGPSSIELDKLTEDMTQYYSRKENQLFHRLDSVVAGDIVVAVYSGDSSFYRARVVAYNLDEYDSSQSTVDLDFVDYGDCEVKPIAEIYEIRTEYLRLNFQAVMCRLARVGPADRTSIWSDEAVDEFERLSSCALWKPIYAKIVNGDSTGYNAAVSTTINSTDNDDSTSSSNAAIVEIELFTLEGEENIAQELVKRGFARFVR